MVPQSVPLSLSQRQDLAHDDFGGFDDRGSPRRQLVVVLRFDSAYQIGQEEGNSTNLSNLTNLFF